MILQHANPHAEYIAYFAKKDKHTVYVDMS